MAGSSLVRLGTVLLLIASMGACDAAGSASSAPPASGRPSPAASASSPEASTEVTPAPVATPDPSDVTLADAVDCPVTVPGDGPLDVAPERFFGWGSAHGNGELWVGGLSPGGIIEAGPGFVEPDNSIGMKFGWWRATPGRLEIVGGRLDAPAPPLGASVPDGYGESGFQASGVSFRTEGCWQVTGRTATTSLTFVTFVVRAER